MLGDNKGRNVDFKKVEDEKVFITFCLTGYFSYYKLFKYVKM